MNSSGHNYIRGQRPGEVVARERASDAKGSTKYKRYFFPASHIADGKPPALTLERV